MPNSVCSESQTPPQSTPLLESAVEQAQEGVLITKGEPIESPGPEITYVNPAFTEITGYEAEEVLGKTPRILQGPETEPWVISRLHRRLKQGKPFEGEAINYRKDGTPFVNQWSIAPVRDNHDRITHWVAVQRDVTDEQRTAERLLEAQEKERARIARKMHDELGGQLASLQMVASRIEALVSNTSAETAPLMNELESQINTLSQTVRRLTDASSSRVLNDFGLSEALSHMANEFADEYDLTVDLQIALSNDEQLPPLLESVLFRVFREAVSNVVEHADTDSVRVRLYETDQGLRGEIIDHGKGFDPSDALQEARSYGLTTIQQRIQRLNGKLSIESQVGEGTHLTVTLPPTLQSSESV